MPQVVAHVRELSAACERMTGVRMQYPVWACAAQFLDKDRAIVLNHLGSFQEEAAHHAPQACPGDADAPIVVETGENRCGRIPTFPRNRRLSSKLQNSVMKSKKVACQKSNRVVWADRPPPFKAGMSAEILRAGGRRRPLHSRSDLYCTSLLSLLGQLRHAKAEGKPTPRSMWGCLGAQA